MTNSVLFMKLIKHRICGISSDYDLPSHLDDDTVREIMDIAQIHDLTAMIGSCLLENNMIVSDKLYDQIQESVCKSACYSEIMEHEVNWLRDLLEKEQIPYIALKGAIVRNIYPESWLRTSGDIDILVQKDMLDKAISILQENGCTPVNKQRYHDVPMRTPRCNILELHFNIQEDIPSMDKVLSRVWEFCETIPGRNHEYRQTREFLLFHLICHMAYHFVHGGCGIRSFVDIWLLQQHPYDRTQLDDLLEQAQLTKFYEHLNLLNAVWFNNADHTPETELLEDLVISGGTFGTKSNQILVHQAYSGNKLGYISKRIFMPHHLLKKQYPILEKYPILLPLCEISRWIRIVFTGRTNMAIREFHTGQLHSKITIQNTRYILQKLGLDSF